MTFLAGRSHPTRRRGAAVVAVVVCLFLGTAATCEPSPWVHVYTDTFDGTTLDQRWSRYTGSPSSDPYTQWDASRVFVQGGSMVLEGKPRAGRPGYWNVGAVSNWRTTQTYGRWTIRYRAPKSSILSYHFLLWPQASHWPPEVDIAEGFDRTRQRIQGFSHYLDANGQRQRVANEVRGDFSTWNTLVLTWTPGSITWALNGTVWATTTGDAVPDEPMWLGLQAETQTCNRSTTNCAADHAGASTRIEIDQVTVESYQPHATNGLVADSDR